MTRPPRNMYINEADDGSLILDTSRLGDDLGAVYRRACKLPRDHQLIVEGADSPDVHARALACAAALHASMIISSNREGVVVATLTIPAELEEPEARNEVPRPTRMDPGLPIVIPDALANDYATLIDGARNGPMPAEPVTVVIPAHHSTSILQITLWALTHQTYPLSLIDIVISDVGSAESADAIVPTFDGQFRSIRYVRQDDRDPPLSDGRTVGIEAAETEWVILLDGVMAPVPRLVELFARHLEAEGRAVYCGHRRYVDATHLEPADVQASMTGLLGLPDIRENDEQATNAQDDEPTIDWRLPIYQATHALRFERDPFRGVSGGNIGFTKRLFKQVGPFDEHFGASGGEVVEWGYRAWNRGNYIIPILDACGLQTEPSQGRHEISSGQNHPLLEEYCPVRFRAGGGKGSFTVPLVSIYVPAYNAVETIVPAIESALHQTIEDLEVCVVDDGSTDGTADLIMEKFGNNPRVRLERQINGGIGAASNRAVRMCRAPFIGQLDADDQLKRNAVERLLGVLRSDPRLGVTYSSSELIDESGQRVGDSYEFPHYSRYDLMYLMIIHHFRLFRARDWHRTAGFATDIKNAVDYDMFLKLSEVTDMVHVPEQLYQYRKHSSSTSQSAHGIQRANHRLAVQRSLDRRGLSRSWKIEPRRPTDPRSYEFAPREGDLLSFGRQIDTVRLSIDVGRKRDEVIPELVAQFPGWTFTKHELSGLPRIHTQELSHARGIRSMEQILWKFPTAKIYLVYP